MKGRGFFGVWLALLLLVPGAYLAWMGRSLAREHDLGRTRESLRRLAGLTALYFPDRKLEQPVLFWKSLGREEPMRDLWGTEFQVVTQGQGPARRIYWRSAGPDQAFGTADDLETEVPYGKTTGSLETMSEDLRPPPLPAISAQ